MSCLALCQTTLRLCCLSDFYGVDEEAVGDADVGGGVGLGDGEVLADAVGLADDGEGVGDGVGLVVLVGCGRPEVGGGDVVGCWTTVLGEAAGVVGRTVTGEGVTAGELSPPTV